MSRSIFGWTRAFARPEKVVAGSPPELERKLLNVFATSQSIGSHSESSIIMKTTFDIEVPARCANQRPRQDGRRRGRRNAALRPSRASLLGATTLTAIACCNPASAAQVEIYGIVDVGVVLEGGGAAGSIKKVTSGVESGSRIGFRGREDLGGGASAYFVLESGFSADTGGGAQGVNKANGTGIFFGRQAIVGITTPSYGSISLGRQYTPVAVTLIAVADPFGTGLAGTSTNIFSTAGLRANNSVAYTSPDLGCFSFGALASFGEQPTGDSRGAGFGGYVSCTTGALQVRGAYFRRNAIPAGVDPAKNTVLAAKYDFGVLRLHAAVEVNKGPGSEPYLGQFFLVAPELHNPYGAATPPTPSVDSRDALIGVTIPVGVGTILASYIDHRDRTALKQDASQFGLGYTYAVSRRTDLYTAYGYIRNRNGAAFTVGNNGDVTYGSGNRAFDFGVRHIF